MANPGNNQQGHAPNISIPRPDPPQPLYRLPAAINISPLFSARLDAYGFHAAAAAVRQTPKLTSEYDLGAFAHRTIQDSARGSAAWETWSTINSMFSTLHATINSQGVTIANQSVTIADQSATLRELNKTNDELCTQLTALQAQFDIQSAALTAATAALTEAAAALTAASAAGPYKSSIGTDPASFDARDQNPFKRYMAYVEWRSRILIRWAVDEHDFPTELKKILHIASLLSGSAFKYVRADIDTIVYSSEHPTQWKWQSGADLLKTLDDLYNPYC